MSFSVCWDNSEKTILRHTYEGLITAADFYQAVEASANLLHTVEHPVDIIVDLTSAYVKSTSFLLSVTSAVERIVPSNQRYIILVKAGVFIRTMIVVARRLAPKATANQHFVDQLQDAYALIEQLNSQQSM